MTCIVGITDGEKVTIGGDSLGSSGSHCVKRLDPKIFRKGEFLVGFTDSFRMGQILMCDWEPPEQKVSEDDIFRYMVSSVIPSIRDVLKASGFAARKDEVESGGNFLIGYRGRLFEIERDYQVGENACRYHATGSGYAYAMGSLHTTSNLETSHSDRVFRALQAAEKFDATVGTPFLIETLG